MFSARVQFLANEARLRYVLPTIFTTRERPAKLLSHSGLSKLSPNFLQTFSKLSPKIVQNSKSEN